MGLVRTGIQMETPIVVSSEETKEKDLGNIFILKKELGF